MVCTNPPEGPSPHRIHQFGTQDLVHSRKNHSRWLAFSGRNQAHNLTSIFHMNVLSNILTGVLEGSSARLLQCSPFPTDTGAVFNSFSKQSCLQTNCSLSPYLCPVGCFREILFKQTRNCHWNQLDFSDIFKDAWNVPILGDPFAFFLDRCK